MGQDYQRTEETSIRPPLFPLSSFPRVSRKYMQKSIISRRRRFPLSLSRYRSRRSFESSTGKYVFSLSYKPKFANKSSLAGHEIPKLGQKSNFSIVRGYFWDIITKRTPLRLTIPQVWSNLSPDARHFESLRNGNFSYETYRVLDLLYQICLILFCYRKSVVLNNSGPALSIHDFPQQIRQRR
jgi:hypothetical protein